MRFFFQVLLLFSLFFPASLTQAQIKNECIFTEPEHLLYMEWYPDNKYFCVDARFLNRCKGPDNGKVTLASSYHERDDYSGGFTSDVYIYSKTDSQIKIAPGRTATGIKKGNKYLLFYGLEGYINRTYLTSAEARINGKKVKALRSGSIRQNPYLLEVSDKVKRVLVNLEDPCKEESYEDTKIEEETKICKKKTIEDALTSLNQKGKFEAALSGLDHKHNLAYVVFLDRKTGAVRLLEYAFDDLCMPIETSYKSYTNPKEWENKLNRHTVDKNLEGMKRGLELMEEAQKHADK